MSKNHWKNLFFERETNLIWILLTMNFIQSTVCELHLKDQWKDFQTIIINQTNVFYRLHLDMQCIRIEWRLWNIYWNIKQMQMLKWVLWRRNFVNIEMKFNFIIFSKSTFVQCVSLRKFVIFDEVLTIDLIWFVWRGIEFSRISQF